MFHTSIYNKDSERQSGFLLFTSLCLYVLTNQSSTKNPWRTEVVMMLEELDYLAVSSIYIKLKLFLFYIFVKPSQLIISPAHF